MPMQMGHWSNPPNERSLSKTTIARLKADDGLVTSFDIVRALPDLKVLWLASAVKVSRGECHGAY